jgi:hypothetical protein
MIWKKIGLKKFDLYSERWFLYLFCFISSDPALLADQRVLENVLRGCQGVHCILDYFSLVGYFDFFLMQGLLSEKKISFD